MTLSLDQGTELCRLLADPSRCRLLLLLESLELSVAELTEVTALTQSRVSTHLSRLKRAGLVQDRRGGSAALYSATRDDSPALQLWQLLRSQIDDGQARLDRERADQVIRARKRGQTWAESVAGRMELHYSPGRTWEATARSLIGLLQLGDVLDLAAGDGVLAELLAGHAHSVTCLDISPAVVQAARKRLAGYGNVQLEVGDMHQLAFPDSSFDHVFAMHALSYSATPASVLRDAARVLRHGGRLIVAVLKTHTHEETMRAFDHLNLGMRQEDLRQGLIDAGLEVEHCEVSSRENRPPYFEVIGAQALKV